MFSQFLFGWPKPNPSALQNLAQEAHNPSHLKKPRPISRPVIHACLLHSTRSVSQLQNQFQAQPEASQLLHTKAQLQHSPFQLLQPLAHPNEAPTTWAICSSNHILAQCQA